MEALRAAGHDVTSMMVAGGATRSKLWLQMHAGELCSLLPHNILQ